MRVNKIALGGIAFAIAVLAYLVFSSIGHRPFRCEVCITFDGASACRSAGAATHDSALRTATENACAQITSGMSNSQRCANTPPDRVTWLAGK